MSQTARLRLVPAAAALAVLGGIAAVAVAGWAAHGEAIFLKLADTAWLGCL